MINLFKNLFIVFSISRFLIQGAKGFKYKFKILIYILNNLLSRFILSIKLSLDLTLSLNQFHFYFFWKK